MQYRSSQFNSILAIHKIVRLSVIAQIRNIPLQVYSTNCKESIKVDQRDFAQGKGIRSRASLRDKQVAICMVKSQHKSYSVVLKSQYWTQVDKAEVFSHYFSKHSLSLLPCLPPPKDSQGQSTLRQTKAKNLQIYLEQETSQEALQVC